MPLHTPLCAHARKLTDTLTHSCLSLATQELRPGQEPLSLEGFLALERSLSDASDAQHIHNKLLYDTANEALMEIYRSCNRIKVRVWSVTVKPKGTLATQHVCSSLCFFA